jgi:hypothetical protein
VQASYKLNTKSAATLHVEPVYDTDLDLDLSACHTVLPTKPQAPPPSVLSRLGKVKVMKLLRCKGQRISNESFTVSGEVNRKSPGMHTGRRTAGHPRIDRPPPHIIDYTIYSYSDDKKSHIESTAIAADKGQTSKPHKGQESLRVLDAVSAIYREKKRSLGVKRSSLSRLEKLKEKVTYNEELAHFIRTYFDPKTGLRLVTLRTSVETQQVVCSHPSTLQVLCQLARCQET